MPSIFRQHTQTKIVYLFLGVLMLGFVALTVAVFAGRRAITEPEFYFLNVGQGDSSLIQLPGGVQVLIDGGPSGTQLMTELARILPPQDRYIDLVLMTHPQLDHFGGFIDLLRDYQVGAFIGTQRIAAIPAYAELHEQIESRGVPYLQLLAGDGIRIGDMQLRVLSPTPRSILSKELNDTSLVVQFLNSSMKALYTGDIGTKTEDWLVDRYDLRSDILKVAHHGSKFSSSNHFLREVAPAVATIGVGKNSYGHPTPAVMQRLEEAGARIFRTDKQGTIKVIRSGEQLDVLGAF